MAAFLWLLMAALVLAPHPALVKSAGLTRRYHFVVKTQSVTRLCERKSIVTVNGQFPGPTITAREGDSLEITVVNQVKYNITLHWHGIRQFRSGWADGPAYITQCPIQTGQSYVYKFNVTGQRGTLFWHAHISWLRLTLYGAMIILPKKGDTYPFPMPYGEVPIILGEWWKTDVEAMIDDQAGSIPSNSDAFTINGLPGPLYNKCSTKDKFKLKVKPGKTYLLRLINAALNEELFFSVANHRLTVVEADAVYVKPFTADTIQITPGQTTNVLLTAKTTAPNAAFLMAARPYSTLLNISFDTTTTAAILEYEHLDPNTKHPNLPVIKPTFPKLDDTLFVTEFSQKLRSLASSDFPANVPRKVDRQFFFALQIGFIACSESQDCAPVLAAGFNNMSFVQPNTALLEAHYSKKSDGVYTDDFPQNPPEKFNYTGNPPSNIFMDKGTKVIELAYNTTVELVLQDTNMMGLESHPLHLHGFNFFVVGQGFGNFDPKKDPAGYNLVDPVQRNTVSVPAGGWVAIRFVADNPGVWFMHCHVELHTTWGLKMAWVVNDGSEENQKLMPPPLDLPKC